MKKSTVKWKYSISVKTLSIIFLTSLIGFALLAYFTSSILTTKIARLTVKSNIDNTERISRDLTEFHYNDLVNLYEEDYNEDSLSRVASFLKRNQEDYGYLYVYLCYLDKDGEVRFLADADYGTPGQTEEFWGMPNDVYEDYEDLLLEPFDSKEPSYNLDLTADEEWGDCISSYTPVFDIDGNVIAVLSVDIPAGFIKTDSWNICKNIIFFAVVLIVIICTSAYIGFKKVVNKINSVNDYVDEVGNNNLSIDINIDPRDELDFMFSNLYDSIKEIRSVISGTMSVCMLTKDGVNSFVNQLDRFQDDFNSLITSMKDVIESAELSNSFSERALCDVEEISSNIHSVNEDFSSLESSLNKVGDAIIDSKGSIDTLTNLIDESIDNIDTKLLKNNFDMNSSLTKLSDIVSSITTISDNINLLALNARIEASRAGEAGRGFVVISQEILNLSKDTEQLVLSVVNGIDNLKNVVDESNTLVVEINSSLATQNKSTLDVKDCIMSIQNNLKMFYSIFENVHNKVSDINMSRESLLESITTISNCNQKTFDLSGSVTDIINECSNSIGSVNESLDSIDKQVTDLENKINIFKLT